MAEVFRTGDTSTLAGSELITTRLTIVPEHGKKFQARFQEADSDIEVVDVAVDGSVFIADFPTPLRWNPDSRSFDPAPDSHFKDVNERGDVLLGGGNYGGYLQVWPVGGSRGRKVDSPRGYQTATVLTNDHLVYVASGRGERYPKAYDLRIRQF